MLHLPSESGPVPHRVDKIQPLLSHLVSAFQFHFYPAQNASVDEKMVGFKGRVKFKLKQYCTDKPTKWGLKVYTSADSNTGYLYIILPYTGRETPEVFSAEFSHINMTGQIVTHLMTPLLGKSHHLFADSYDSGVGLAMELHR